MTEGKEFKKEMNIILVGFMGSGRSVVGKALAKKLKMDFIEMNDLTLKKSGRKTITEIFDKDGEYHFRELEIDIAKELAKKKHTVISTGGGVIYNKVILDYFKKNGYIIHLRTAFAEAYKRIKDQADRPLFRNPREARRLYDFRKPLYREYSDNYVRTDEKTVDEIAEEIIDLLHDK